MVLTNLNPKHKSAIHYIYHISDIHIRLYDRHEEYKSVFENLYSKLSKIKHKKNSVIVICGDILHSKTILSPELIILTRSFLTSLSNILPTLIIAGNHDINLSNPDRIDGLIPILEGLNQKYLYYLDISGHYKYNNIIFGVSSLKGFKSVLPPLKEEGHYSIGLYHGTLNNSVLDNNYELKDNISVSDFEGYDYVLLGDIHKYQYLNSSKTVGYSSSLIQQNHGEERLMHGVLKWNLSNGKSNLIKIGNDYSYLTLHINNNNFILPKMTEYTRLRIIYKKTSYSEVLNIVDKIKKEYSIIECHIQEETQEIKNNLTDTLNINSLDYQNKKLEEFCLNKYPDKTINKLKILNNNLNSNLVNEEQTLTSWHLDKIEFSNLFCYGDGNIYNFRNSKGLIGLLGKNHIGKSALLDIITYGLYNKCNRGILSDIMNKDKNSSLCRVYYSNNGNNYIIERLGKRNRKTVISKLNYYCNGELINEVSQMDTNKKIVKNIGSYTSFHLCSILTLNDKYRILDKSQIERKQLFSDLLNLGIYERLYEECKKQITEKKYLLKELEKEDIDKELNNSFEKSQLVESEILFTEEEITKLKKEIVGIELEIDKYYKSLKPVTKMFEKDYSLLKKNIVDKLQNLEVNENIDELYKKMEDLLINFKNTTPITELKEVRNKLEKEYDNKTINLDSLIKEKEELLKNIYNIEIVKPITIENDIETINEKLLLEIEELKVHEYKYEKQYHILEEYDLLKSTIEKLNKIEHKHSFNPSCNSCIKNKFYFDNELVKNKMEIEGLTKKLETFDKQHIEEIRKEKHIFEQGNELKRVKLKLEYEKNRVKILEQDKYKKMLEEQKHNESILDRVNEINEIIEYQTKQKDISIKIEENAILIEEYYKNEKVSEEIKILKNKIEHLKLEEELKILIDEEQEYNKYLSNVKSNDEINKLLKMKTNILVMYRDKLKETEKKYYLLENSKETINLKMVSLKEKLKQLLELRDEVELNNLYLFCVCKSGIPNKILCDFIPYLENKINDMLSIISSFQICLNLLDHRITILMNCLGVMYDVKLSSGYESMIIELCFKIALNDYSNMMKNNLLIVDEIFSQFDSENLNGIGVILNYIRSRYENIIIITHNEDIKGLVDRVVLINNDNQISRLI